MTTKIPLNFAYYKLNQTEHPLTKYLRETLEGIGQEDFLYQFESEKDLSFNKNEFHGLFFLIGSEEDKVKFSRIYDKYLNNSYRGDIHILTNNESSFLSDLPNLILKYSQRVTTSDKQDFDLSNLPHNLRNLETRIGPQIHL